MPLADPLDIAEAAAVCPTDARHSGVVYELTGPEVVTPREQVATIATALGEPVRFHELTRAEALELTAQQGPAELANDTLDIIGSPLALELRISLDVERLLGRAPRLFSDWVGRNLDAFR